MNRFYRKYGKRWIDFLAAALLLMLFSVPMLIVALILWITNHRPVLFVQPRAGLNGKIFKLVKFKSMNDSRTAKGELLPDADRLTAVGKFIRKTSLDELPQLFNVLKGDMSLIGPRPLLVSYLPLYSPEQMQRHQVRPGITGWAQVNGRNVISWQKKFEYDRWYVKHLSFKLDIRILYLTVINTLTAKGISQEGQATVQAFTGNHES